MSIPDGTKLGPYEIVCPIGAGGMGEVYRAKDTRLGRDVAIKVLPDALAKDADRLRRFEQEARTIAALNHPNILGIHDIGTQDGTPFLVSELLEGETLREKIDAGPLSAKRAMCNGSRRSRKPSATAGCVVRRGVPATRCNARRCRSSATNIYRRR
jgi:eukaryotic-like serine/threonine-protein kinase